MAPPEEHDRQRERPQEQPAETEAFAPSTEQEPATDVKIKELEQQLEQLRQMRAGEQTERLRTSQAEQAELSARRQEQAEYRQMEAGMEKTGSQKQTRIGAEKKRAAAVGQLSAAKLLGDDPQTAVNKLVQLASSSTGGFQRAVDLVRSVAGQPGGAWILDEFHKRMTQKSQPTKGAGETPRS